jgi:hypothetical protein
VGYFVVQMHRAAIVDAVWLLVAVVVTEANAKLFNILLTDVNGCKKDKLTFSDNSGFGNTNCGAFSYRCPEIYSDGNFSFHFTTDGNGSGTGFILTYKLSKSQVGTINDTLGSINCCGKYFSSCDSRAPIDTNVSTLKESSCLNKIIIYLKASCFVIG